MCSHCVLTFKHHILYQICLSVCSKDKNVSQEHLQFTQNIGSWLFLVSVTLQSEVFVFINSHNNWNNLFTTKLLWSGLSVAYMVLFTSHSLPTYKLVFVGLFTWCCPAGSSVGVDTCQLWPFNSFFLIFLWTSVVLMGQISQRKLDLCSQPFLKGCWLLCCYYVIVIHNLWCLHCSLINSLDTFESFQCDTVQTCA